jgi:hypothetical protein
MSDPNGLSSLTPRGGEGSRAQALELAERILQPAFLAYARAEQTMRRHSHDTGYALARAMAHAVAGFANDASGDDRAACAAWVDFLATEIRRHAHEALAAPHDCAGCKRSMEAPGAT